MTQGCSCRKSFTYCQNSPNTIPDLRNLLNQLDKLSVDLSKITIIIFLRFGNLFSWKNRQTSDSSAECWKKYVQIINTNVWRISETRAYLDIRQTEYQINTRCHTFYWWYIQQKQQWHWVLHGDKRTTYFATVVLLNRHVP